MVTGFSIKPSPRPPAFASAGAAAWPPRSGVSLGSPREVLNASRVPLNMNYLAGLQDGEPAVASRVGLPHTGQPRLDRALDKMGGFSGYGWQCICDVMGGTGRGVALGVVAGGLLGLAGSCVTKAMQKTWPAWAVFPVGVLGGGILGGSVGGTLALIRSGVEIVRNTRHAFEKNKVAQSAPASVSSWVARPIGVG